MNKDFLLNESETFCILPWISMMMPPSGHIYPCCVSEMQHTFDDPYRFGRIEDDIDITINNDKFKELRLNMLNNVKSKSCDKCYLTKGFSFREGNNQKFAHLFDETVPNTNIDGSIDNFKMRYVDLRFSNVCNFKCRTCGPIYSSSWTHEYTTHVDKSHGINVVIKPNTDIIEKLTEHIDSIEEVYFAGGEPILMDEHYQLLDLLISKNRTDVRLFYNTNASRLSYKDKNIFDYWKHFTNINVSASIDHIGERAEYIRHGTDWAIVEQNLININNFENVNFSISNVVSIYNYLTLDMFYERLTNLNLINNNVIHLFCYGPMFANPIILPKRLKTIGNNIISNYPAMQYIDYVNSKDCWEEYRNEFQRETKFYDSIRNEDFVKVFPELREMING